MTINTVMVMATVMARPEEVVAMETSRKILRLLLCVQMLTMATVAYGFDFDAQVRAGIGVSDNIARTPQNEIDETISTVGFDFGVVEETNKLDLNIRSNFDYVDYADDTFESELVGGLTGAATFTLIDERLRWVVQDTFGQSLFDPLQPARPNNREDVNFFATGPTLSLTPGSRNPIILDLRYSRMDFEVRPNDNDRLSGALSIGRDISREGTLSLNLNATRIEYDNGFTPPVEQYEAYGRFETIGTRSTLGFDLGYNEVEFDGIDGDGILARVDYTRQTSANGNFSISGGSQFSEQGNIFRFIRDVTQDLTDTSDITNSPAPFQNNFFALSYSLDQERYSIVTSVDWNQEDYKGDQGIDRDIFRGNLIFRREVSRTVFAGANIGLNRREFKYLDRRDDDLILGLNVGYRFTAGLDVSFEYQHFQRNSVTPEADFTENRAFIRFSYTPVWSR